MRNTRSGNECPCSGQQIVTAREFSPEALLRAIIEMSDDAIFTCDVDGRIVTWSITAERLFGRSAKEVMDGPLDVLFPSHLSDGVQIVIAAALAGDRIRHFETEALRPDGMPQPVSISLCPVL